MTVMTVMTVKFQDFYQKIPREEAPNPSLFPFSAPLFNKSLRISASPLSQATWIFYQSGLEGDGEGKNQCHFSVTSAAMVLQCNPTYWPGDSEVTVKKTLTVTRQSFTRLAWWCL